MCSFIKGLFELVLFILNSVLFLAGGAAAGLGCLSLLKVSAINNNNNIFTVIQSTVQAQFKDSSGNMDNIVITI